jgi:hypothetical protein
VVVAALVVAGLSLDSDDLSRADERMLGPTSASATPSPTPSNATPSASAPSSSALPVKAAASRSATPARATRSAMERATGRAADGSRLAVPVSGSGRFAGARVQRRPAGGRGRVLRFDVRVEREVPVESDDAARLVAAVLDDDRSWRGAGGARFRLVARGEKADVHAYLATPKTTDRLCAPLLTRGEVSCQNGRRVVLNARRWVNGSRSYGDDPTGYRRYLVNHEFGHTLGRQHVGCPRRGALAPVMMQQTKGLGGCRANPWPRRTRG